MLTKSHKRIFYVVLSFAIIILFRLLPVPQGMTPSAMHVIGIFIGAMVLWLSVAIDWPSLLCLALLAMLPELSMDKILGGSIGNSTFSFLMFTFLCTYALSQTPFIRRCAVGFITSRLAQKGPWAFSISFFAAVILIGMFISPTVLFVIFLPILEEIYATLKIEKGESPASMLMIGLVVCCGISCGMTTIAHVFPIMALNYYADFSGVAISHFSYSVFAIPVGIITFLLMMLVFRFVMRPNMEKLKNANVSILKKDAPKMDRKEVTILLIFGIVVLLWVLPELFNSFKLFPVFSGAIKQHGTAFPPLLGAIALCLLTFKGKPLLNFQEGMSKGVPWGSLIMSAGSLALGSAITNGDIGLTAFLSTAIEPHVVGISAILMVALFAFWAAAQTNLSSNMVTVTVVTAIAIPLTAATGGSVNTAAMCAVIGMIASYAFAFPPAMPCVAIAGASGWTTAGSLAKYGGLLAILSTLVTIFVGYPIANMVM